MEKLERMNILLVGNNPIELSTVDSSIEGFGRGLLKTTFIFDLKSIAQSIKKLNPAGIFIDDKLNIKEIKNTILKLRRNKNTSHIPITLIKSSNFLSYPNLGADDFILHTNMSGKGIYQSVTNGARFRKSSVFFKNVYLKQQGKLAKLHASLNTLFY